MNTTPSSNPHFTPTTGSGRALVLGGGGSTGNAWLIGVLAGLLDAGLDVTRPDVVIGTSAGSTAAAQTAGASPAELLAAIVGTAPRQPGPAGSDGGRSAARPVTDHLARTEDHCRCRGRRGHAAQDGRGGAGPG